jgi:hypothetical protein
LRLRFDQEPSLNLSTFQQCAFRFVSLAILSAGERARSHDNRPVFSFGHLSKFQFSIFNFLINDRTKSIMIMISVMIAILVLQALIAPVYAAPPDFFFSASDDGTMRKWIFNSTTSQNTAVTFSGMQVYSLALGNGGQTVYSGVNSGSSGRVFTNDATTLVAGTTYTGPTNAMDNLIVIGDTLLCANWGA